MYNLVEYSNNYSKAGSLWQYYRDEPNHKITESESFKSKTETTEKTPDNRYRKNVAIVVQLKYLNNFWKSLEMPLINCETILNLTWSEKYVISSAVRNVQIKITDATLCVSVVTLSTEYNGKLLKQLKFGFKNKINWNK